MSYRKSSAWAIAGGGLVGYVGAMVVVVAAGIPIDLPLPAWLTQAIPPIVYGAVVAWSIPRASIDRWFAATLALWAAHLVLASVGQLITGRSPVFPPPPLPALLCVPLLIVPLHDVLAPSRSRRDHRRARRSPEPRRPGSAHERVGEAEPTTRVTVVTTADEQPILTETRQDAVAAAAPSRSEGPGPRMSAAPASAATTEPSDPQRVVDEMIEREASGADLRISFDRIVSQLPATAFLAPTERVAESLAEPGYVLIPRRLALVQLGEGLVRAGWEVVTEQFPRALLAMTDQEITRHLADGQLVLPLDEVVRQMPMGLFRAAGPSPDWSSIESFPAPFQQVSPVDVDGAPDEPPVEEPMVEAPVTIEQTATALDLASVAAPAEEVVSAAGSFGVAGAAPSRPALSAPSEAYGQWQEVVSPEPPAPMERAAVERDEGLPLIPAMERGREVLPLDPLTAARSQEPSPRPAPKDPQPGAVPETLTPALSQRERERGRTALPEGEGARSKGSLNSRESEVERLSQPERERDREALPMDVRAAEPPRAPEPAAPVRAERAAVPPPLPVVENAPSAMPGDPGSISGSRELAAAREIAARLTPLTALDVDAQVVDGVTLYTVCGAGASRERCLMVSRSMLPFLDDPRAPWAVAQMTLRGPALAMVLTPLGSPVTGGPVLVATLAPNGSLALLEILCRRAAVELVDHEPADRIMLDRELDEPELLDVEAPTRTVQLASSLHAVGPVSVSALRDAESEERLFLFLPAGSDTRVIGGFAADVSRAVRSAADLGMVFTSAVLRSGRHFTAIQLLDSRSRGVVVAAGATDRPGLAFRQVDRAAVTLAAV